MRQIKSIALFALATLWIAQAAGADDSLPYLPPGEVAFPMPTGVDLTLEDKVTGACWTNPATARGFVAEKLAVRDILVDDRFFFSSLRIFGSGARTEQGICYGSINLTWEFFNYHDVTGQFLPTTLYRDAWIAINNMNFDDAFLRALDAMVSEFEVKWRSTRQSYLDAALVSGSGSRLGRPVEGNPFEEAASGALKPWERD